MLAQARDQQMTKGKSQAIISTFVSNHLTTNTKHIILTTAMALEDIISEAVRTAKYATLASTYTKVTTGREM